MFFNRGENMEEYLVKALKLGEKDAFVKLMESYEKKLYVIARSRLECEEDVKDALQDTSLEVLASIDKLKNDDSFNAWISRILINKCNDIIKKKIKYCYSYEELSENNPSLIEYYDNFIYVDSNMDLFSLVDFLPIEEQTIVVLYFSEGYTTNEIANILDMNENTVRTKVRRIKEKIQMKYGKEYLNDWNNRRYY